MVSDNAISLSFVQLNGHLNVQSRHLFAEKFCIFFKFLIRTYNYKKIDGIYVLRTFF